MHDLVVRDDFSTFPRINTLSGNPIELAKQVVDIVESDGIQRMLATPVAAPAETGSVVSERDRVSAAVMPNVGFIAQHTTASQSVVDSAQKSDDANQQPISPKK